MKARRQAAVLEIYYAGLLQTRAWRVGTTHCVFQFCNGTWGGRRAGDIFGCCSGPDRASVELIIYNNNCTCQGESHEDEER
jgi:hypothetical protein